VTDVCSASILHLHGRSDFGSATSTSSFLMGWTGGFVLLANVASRLSAQVRQYTVPDFVGDSFNSNAARASR